MADYWNTAGSGMDSSAVTGCCSSGMTDVCSGTTGGSSRTGRCGKTGSGRMTAGCSDR